MSAWRPPQVTDREGYRRLYRDDALWVPAMRELALRHGLDPERLRRVREGSEIVYEIEDGPFLKLYTPLWPEDAAVEMAALEAVQALPLVTPRRLASGELAGWPYVVISRVPGISWQHAAPALSDEELLEPIERLAEGVAAFHRLTFEVSPGVASYETLLHQQRERLRSTHAHPTIDKTWLIGMQAWVARYWPENDAASEVLLHADLTSEHVLLEETSTGWRLGGLIDFADVMRGDPRYEAGAVGIFLTARRPRLQRRFWDAYRAAGGEVDLSRPEVLTSLTVLHRYGSLASTLEACPGPRPRDPRELHEALWGGLSP